jgi:hypothetical protein
MTPPLWVSYIAKKTPQNDIYPKEKKNFVLVAFKGI